MNLSEILLPELAFDAPPVTSQGQLFDLIASRLLEAKIAQDSYSLIAGFCKREKLCSTAVGHGVAIPHSCTSAVDRIIIVIIRLKTAVDWRARDNQPVNLVVALISPPSLYSVYLQVLATLARVLRLESVRRLVLDAPSPAEAAKIIARVAGMQEQGTEGFIEPVC